MDLRKVKKLIELLESSALVEMEITEGDSTIRLSRAAYPPTAPPAHPHPAISHIATDQAPNVRQDIESGQSHAESIGNTVESPMVGTFYESASPDSEPYVTIGSVVKPGDILCVIEAMKTFNQLETDIAGTIKAIYKSSGDPVEFGEPLFLIE
ncbi:acetyl-CoA carboxylase biotin carboxyl carrier protein [Candidatus Spongiihabitans sp.]|uniref:acetyl-CoA carboxylase biotin carboxyl carrier protein n=1 Tax=Candidatus Spongiihabitans sp. TaxID=3101308 RepID=UPI003C7A1789